MPGEIEIEDHQFPSLWDREEVFQHNIGRTDVAVEDPLWNRMCRLDNASQVAGNSQAVMPILYHPSIYGLLQIRAIDEFHKTTRGRSARYTSSKTPRTRRVSWSFLIRESASPLRSDECGCRWQQAAFV